MRLQNKSARGDESQLGGLCKAMIYLIGGITCGGKTTLAQKLSALYNIEVYKIDDDIIKFTGELDFFKSINNPLDYIFSLTVAEQVEFYLKIYESVFDKIAAKIKTLNKNDLIVEGTALLPDLVKRFPFEYKYILLHPTNNLIKQALPSRRYIKYIINGNLNRLHEIYERNILLDSHICELAEKYRVPIITVDDFSKEQTYKLAIKYFDFEKSIHSTN